MSYDLEPTVGQWYRLIDKSELFRVLAVDADNDTVEVRWFEGDVEELDLSSWFEMDLEQAEAPEGWTDPDEDVEEADEDDKKGSRRGSSRDEDDDRLGEWEDDDDDDDDDDEDDDWDDDDADDR